MIVGVMVAVGSGDSCLVGEMQLAVMTLVDFVTERVGWKSVRVTRVTVFVVVTGRGVDVTV